MSQLIRRVRYDHGGSAAHGARVQVVAATIAVLVASFAVAHSEEPPWTPGSTTIAVLPDTERYSDDHPHYFEAQTRWIAERRRSRNIAYVAHLGDITQHNAPAEWDVAKRCFRMLDGRVPYALAPGNHDYEGNAPRRASSRLSEYFPVDEFRRWPTYGGVFEKGRIENSFHLLEIGERRWIIVVLEMGPRDEVVAWASRVLERHQDRLAIVVTHAYLFRDNERYDHTRGKQRASPHGWGNDGEQLWQKLVRRRRNVMMVLSGHVSTGGLGYRASVGDYGNIVHQMMVDYEKHRGGGQAFLRLLEFLPDGKTVQVRSYSPALGQSKQSKLEDFRFELVLPTRTSPAPVDDVPSTPLAKAPVHRYSFDGSGAQGARITDRARKSHGILHAEKSSSKLDGEGRLILDGNGHVRLPSKLLAGLEDMSFEIWFTPTAETYKWNSVVRFGSRDDWLTYVFRTRTVHRAEIAVDRHNEDIQRKMLVEVGKPMHVVVTYDHDGSEGQPLLSYFRDGRPYGQMRTSLSLRDVDDSASTLGPFVGSYDELRVYDYALSPPEVQGSFRTGPQAVELSKDAKSTRAR